MGKVNEAVPVIYCGALELHGDLFFASLEFHDLVETLPVIHNYALTYALDLCTEESGRVSPLYLATERRKQQPQYADDFARLVQQRVYVSPAKPATGSVPTVVRQYASRIDEYLHAGRKIDSVLSWEPNPQKRKANTLASIFPLHGYMKVVTVGARFLFYIYNPPSELPMKRFIRLGKFNTKAEVRFFPCSEIVLSGGVQTTTHPVNVNDVDTLVPLNLTMMRPCALATVAQLGEGQSLQVAHQNPWDFAKSITSYLPIKPAYCSRVGEKKDAKDSDRGSKTQTKRRSRR